MISSTNHNDEKGRSIVKNPKISVIVPIYMVEKYLTNCMRSILEQDYSNIELIAVVDESSEDRCEEIIDEYIKKDKRVSKYIRGHLGLGDARNYGMRFATGDYLIFVDSDDHFCKRNYLSEIVRTIEEDEPDYIITRYRKYDEETKKVQLVSRDWDASLLESGGSEKKMIHILDSGSFGISAWAKAYKTSFIQTNGLSFSDGYSEDIDWTGKVLNLTKKIDVLYIDGYSYLVRSDSLSKGKNIKQIMDVADRLDSWEKSLTGSSEYENAQRGYIAYYFFILLGLIPYLPKEERKMARKRVMVFKRYTSFSRSKKTRLANAVCKVIGYRIGEQVLHRYIKKGIH